MKTILTIMKKEFARVFKDPKLIIMSILFPGLMIYGMYSLMANLITEDDDKDYTYLIYSENIPDDINVILSMEELDFHAEYNEITNLELHKMELQNNKIDFIIIFPSTFSSDIENGLKPNIEIYYNPYNIESANAYRIVSTAINIYRDSLISEKFGDITVFTTAEAVIANIEKETASIMAMILPFLILTFLFQGAMTLGPESIAGEKERGTISNLLITPTKRRDIALGKVLSLAILSSLSAISSFLGIILSLPKMMGIEMGGEVSNIYSFGDYLAVFAVLLLTVLVIISLISILSAIAKNIKEASLIILPLYLLTIGLGIFSMFAGSSEISNTLFLIPLYNSMQMLTQIFTLEINYIQFAIMALSNIVVVVILIYILTVIFSKEKWILSK